MRLLASRAICLGSPTALAFFAGGFNDRSRHIALIVTAAGLVLAALLAPVPLPRGRTARLTLGALGLFCGWTALSATWAPLPYQASDDAQRVLLYLVVFAIAVAVWRPRRAARWVEPALAAGALGVILTGLSGRLLPSIVTQHSSVRAGGRLDQPLTYWNAEGALAAMGLVLCARIAGDSERRPLARMAAAAATVPLATGLYLTFSRGALAALAGGLLVLVVAAPTWSQLRAIALCARPASPGSVAAGLSGRRPRPAGHPRQAGQGAGRARRALLAGGRRAAALTALAVRPARRPRHAGRPRPPALERRGRRRVVVALVVLPIVVGGANPPGTSRCRLGATNQRLSELGSNRPEYWRVALDAFSEDPVARRRVQRLLREWLRSATSPRACTTPTRWRSRPSPSSGWSGRRSSPRSCSARSPRCRRVHGVDPVLAAGPSRRSSPGRCTPRWTGTGRCPR